MQPDWLLKISKSYHIPCLTLLPRPVSLPLLWKLNPHSFPWLTRSGPWLRLTPSLATPPWLTTFQPHWPSSSSWNFLSLFLPLPATLPTAWPLLILQIFAHCFCRKASAGYPLLKQFSQYLPRSPKSSWDSG